MQVSETSSTNRARERYKHTPFHRPVKPLPAAVEGLGLEASARHPGLLSLLHGAGVDDVAFVRVLDGSLQEQLVLLAAPPVGSWQRLAAAQDHLQPRKQCSGKRAGSS